MIQAHAIRHGSETADNHNLAVCGRRVRREADNRPVSDEDERLPPITRA